ncbi:MAG: hypothetical protein R3C68_18620 [Myxococcota bacterium]
MLQLQGAARIRAISGGAWNVQRPTAQYLRATFPTLTLGGGFTVEGEASFVRYGPWTEDLPQVLTATQARTELG